MSNPWFRVYTEMVDDEKIRLLAFEDRWHYVAILCCKGKGILDASPDLSMTMRKLSVKLGLTVRELETVLSRLSEVGLVDAETGQPTGWDSRQFVSDTSTERVRAYRERMKRSGNVAVTAQDTDTDTDTDTEKKPKSKARPSVARPHDVDEGTWGDWLALRKAKRAPVTETVVKQARVEAGKANIPLTRFLEIWCARGSQGLQADWLHAGELGQPRAGPAPQKPMGKQAQGLMALEAMKSGNRVAEGRTSGGASKDLLLGTGTDTSR